MKTDAILSKREREVMNLVVLGYSAREIADWYFTQNFGITLNVSEMTRRVGAAVLLCLFSVEVFSTDFECRRLRNPRRSRGFRVEELIEN